MAGQVQTYFSHQWEALADTLAEGLATAADDPFVRPRVVVPNPQVKRWLQLHIAEHLSVAANIDFAYLKDGLWALLAELDTGAADGETAVQALTPLQRQLLVLARLLDGAGQGGGRDGLAPLRSMLQQPDGRPCANAAERAWQLAGQLAAYQEEYEYDRHDMVRAWLAGEPGLDVADDDPYLQRMVDCQMTLYRELFAEGGLRDRVAAATGTAAYSLP